MKINAVGDNERMRVRKMKMKKSLWSIRAWMFALIVSMGMILGVSAAQGAEISGTIYNDVGGSLSYRADRDFPVEGVTVKITNVSTSEVTQIVTGADGIYTADLTAGYSYKIAVDAVPAGYGVASGEATVVLSAGGSAGNHLGVRGLGGSIAGLVFEDTNRNLVFDGSDGSISNIRVYLKKGGTVISTLDTVMAGYEFKNLPSGIGYTVEIEEEDLTGYGLVGTTDSTISSPKRIISVASVTSAMTGKNFAVTEINSGGILGYVVNDIDKDNAYNDAYIYDLPVAGATITLYYGDGVTPVPGVAAATSGASGTYKLSNIPLWNSYKIKVSNLPVNFTSTGTVAGTTAPLDTITLDVATKESAYGANNFFIQGTESKVGGIKGNAFIDLNMSLPFPNGAGKTTNNPDGADNRLNQVLITLKKDGTDYLQQYTKNGAYSFVGIPAGNYEVVVDQASAAIPVGYRFDDDYDGYRDGKISETIASSTVGSRNFWWLLEGARSGSLYSRAGYRIQGDKNSIWSGTTENEVALGGVGIFIPGTFQFFYVDGASASAPFAASFYGHSSAIPAQYPAMPYGRYLVRSLGIGTPAGWNATGDLNFAVKDGVGNDFSYPFLGEVAEGISGRVFVDFNKNDAYDGGEELYRVIVRLYDDTTGTHLGQRVSNPDGTYGFYNLAPGKYRIEIHSIANVDGALQEMMNSASREDNDGLTSDGILYLTLESGGLTDQNIWINVKDDLTHRIQGKVHVDSFGGLNATGGNGQLDTRVTSYISDPVDFYLKGATVTLYKGSVGGAPAASLVTGADGSYQFEGLDSDATYYVVVAMAGYTGIVNNGQDLPGDTHTVTFGSLIEPWEGTSKNFLMKGEGQVTGTIFIDYDGDGKFTAGEQAHGNIPQNQLLIWDDELNDWRLLVNCGYSRNDFYHLGPGKYRIAKNWTFIYANTYDPNSIQTADFVIGPGNLSPQIDFFAANPNSNSGGLSGTIRLDSNGDGIIDNSDLPLTGLTGVTVEFYRTHQLRDSIEAGTAPVPIYTAAVNSDGTYSAPGGLRIFPPGMGNFILKLTGLPAEYTLINDYDGPAQPTATDLGITSPLGTTQVVIRDSLIANVDFLVKTETEIRGQVFQDVDFNSIYSSEADTVITGRVISLYDSSGTTLLTTQNVNSNGEYLFTSLPNGDYVVKIDGTPTGMVIAGGSQNSWNVTLSSSAPSAERNFWYNLDGDAGIAGSVMIDVNNNGDAENGYDFPLKNVTVTLYESDGTTLVNVVGVTNPTLTNSRGAYKFIGIPTGTYVVDISTLVSDYSVYKTYNGLGAPLVTTAKRMTVVMPTKAMYTDRIFLLAGNTNTDPGGGPGGGGSLVSGISGYLYVGDSVSRPAGTVYLANVEVTLTNGDGASITTKTDGNGRYQFYNLAAGAYTVSLVSNPSGYSVKGDVDAGTPVGKINVAAAASSESSEQNIWFIAISEKGMTGKVSYSPTNDINASVTDVAVPNLTMELYDAANPTGLPLYTTTINANGEYEFLNIPTMEYVVKVKAADKTNGGFIDLNPASGSLSGTVPSEGLTNQNFILGGTRTLSGKIGVDSDGDDAIDIDLENIHTQVTWAGPDGAFGTADDAVFTSDSGVTGILQTTGKTNATGNYSYITLPNGNFKIEVLDAALIAGGKTIITTIAGNENPQEKSNVTVDQANINFIYGYTGSIGGKVTIDVDRSQSVTGADQIMTTASPLTIRLEESTNSANFKEVTTTDGTFSFPAIDPSKTWKIFVKSGMQAGYTFSFGHGDSLNTTAVNAYATVALTVATPSKTDVVLGYKGSGKIQGKVVMDNVLTDGRIATAADTSLGANIKVTVSSTQAGFTSWTVNTLADGSYEINELAPYVYTISIDKTQTGFQAGLVESFDPDSTETAPTPPTGDGSAVITITTPTEILNQKDFGYKGRGSISGKILIDIEGSGTKTVADTSFGSAITVTATNGLITRTTSANATTGAYSFDTIPTGIWEIYVSPADLPAGYSFSYGEGTPIAAIEVGTDRVKVDINSALATKTVPTLKAVEVNLGYKGSAKIGGRLIYDNDDTDGGIYNSSIDTLFAAGYTVTLTGGSGFTPVTVTTNASGEYEFTGLTTYADYKVTVTSPTGYVASFDPDSAAVVPPAIPVGDGEAVLPITGVTEVKTLQDFGFKGTGKIAGKIYIDLNDNGTYESAVDQPKNGITVTLTHATLPARTAITDLNGDYAVTGVAAGTWTATITGGLSGLRTPSFDFDDPYDPASAPATPLQAAVTLTTGSPIEEHVDFGFINRGKLEGVIKEDNFASGLYDPSAAGIAGVTVHLVENDGVTPKTYADGTPIILTTDANGLFTARNLDCPTTGATYSVRVEFGPTTIGPLSLMEPSYDSDTLGVAGCGSGVNLAAGTHVVNADLAAATAFRSPTDLHLGYRLSTGDIVIHKVAGKPTAKIGDIVPYTITIENKSDAPALNITIEDLIPAGFKYVEGSTRLDGDKIDDPTGNRPLKFEKMNLGGASGAGSDPVKRKLSYFLVVGSGVTQGEYTNTAIAKDQFNRNASNVSQATVEITSDPLFDDSLIFGKVYIDRNGNGEQDVEEEGLGGIKLITARGEIITTDEHGRYHIPAVDGGRWERGRNFIIKLDVRSLPAGYKVISDNPIVVRTSPGLPSKINFRVIQVNVEEAK